MSRTSTIPQTRTAISRSSSILLSPSKRRKLDSDQPEQQSPKRESANATVPNESSEKAQPTPTELYRWTFTRAAVTACFVRDVFEMKVSGFRDMEFFWLGRIPCRTVRLIGLLVGVSVWDRRTVYTIDDGTAVLDCAFAHAQTAPPSPVKPKRKAAAPVDDNTTRGGPSYSDYLLSARKEVPITTSVPPSRAEPPPPPKPIARVGQSVRIVGRVVSRHDTRILLVDEISPCVSYNDEPNHWLTVTDLHRTTYYPSETLPPFVPPPLSIESILPSYSRPRSPSKRAAAQEPTTPPSVRFAGASANNSPSTSVTASSPASSTAGDVKQIRLRHPSRLHTRDLTSNTFRIYVKHYMDNAPPPPRRRRFEARSVSPSPTPRRPRSEPDVEDTPTKTCGTKRGPSNDATPRPSRRRRLEDDHTSRSSQVTKAETDADPESDQEDKPEADDQMYGFTLSHLRRVPELSLLARRVIAADAHRREKEQRKKAKAQASQSKDKGKAKVPVSSSSSRPSGMQAPTGLAVKKLFKLAIRTLFQEGDIVLWSGPVRPLPIPSLDPMLPASLSSELWKANSSTSSVISSASTSSSSRSKPNYEEWDDDEVLSDPSANEEAYVPLTPAYFSRVLEHAIRSMVREKMVKARGTAGEATPRPASKSIVERLKAQEKERERGPPPGPTKGELLAWLRNSDERWARVGEWTVEEALERGRREGRLWCIGKGRWEVCE